MSTNNIGHKRQMMISITIMLAVIIIGSLWLLGWLVPRKSWQETTGWKQLQPSQRPVEKTALPDEPWIRWLGHSGFVIRWHGTTLLLDPNVSDHCTVSKRIMEFPPQFGAMGPVHVLISHAHFDHLNQDTLVSISDLTSIVIPDGSDVFLDRIHRASTQVIPAHMNTTYQIGSLRVTPVHAVHNGNRFHPLHSKFDAFGYMIQSPEGTTLYYAGDTAYDNRWKELRETFHPDMAILPIGAYAPRIPLKYHHVNPEEAVAAAAELGVKKVIPCHFGTFTLSFDRPHAALPRFAHAMKGQAFSWDMPQLLSERDVEIMAADSSGDQKLANKHDS